MNSLVSRRQMLANASTGFGMAALAGLMQAETHVVHRAKRFTPKARSVIFCYMSGGVSHIDSFDPKPLLEKYAGKPMPGEVKKTQFNNNGTVQPSHWAFHRHGQCGMPVSELFPHMATIADEICQIRSMTAKFSEHAQGNIFMHSGFPFLGYPSAGAWTSYGLGTESRDLPGYIVLQSGGAVAPHGGVGLFSNGFLPAQHQASIVIADEAEAVANIQSQQPRDRQRRQLDFIGSMDRRFARASQNDIHVEAAISNYELAWRMQSAVPELCDISGETEATKKLYGMDGPDSPRTAYARQCLLARRLVERGVRFVELSCLPQTLGGGQGPNPWDQHGQIKKGHANMAHQVDQPIAALVKDLKSRGLLDSTLVVWAGEFGRTPFAQGSDGRDHNPYGFTIWMAGGGIKPGHIYGATDDFGYHAIENVSTVYDMWATVLHLMGIDHEQLTYRFSGRDLRLTDVHGNVLHDVIA
ncbi:DUF1501 domain-containing protein [Prosthecobacter sp.]|uniref:DUF1501 domain-containing protein n=1 Tax=Prosthecobacter sp. TaxID=1965333 RepID=UPI001DED083A|nr:DUF1501 domain-containing protein [Prosthecobacter sp.]MCB1276734.1 DUF1501 domain-containing protein [Prosthecobacter sp.]